MIRKIGSTVFPFAVMLVLLSSCRPGKPVEEDFSSIETNTTTVTRVSIQERVTVSGHIAPYKIRKLGFTSTGKITAIETSEGQWEKEGTVLARMDTSSDEYAIEAKEYDLEQASFSESPRKIRLMQKELDSLKKRMQNKIITAPFDGIVATISQREGEIATENSREPLIQFIDDTKLKAEVVVDELYISRIALDQSVIFTFEAIPGEKFEGRVSKIARIGRINQRGLPVVDVEIIMDDPDPRIFIPYFFKAEILVAEPMEYIVMDEKAIIWRDDKVYANLIDPLNADRLIERQIRIKPWKDGQVIILDGLEEGDVVTLRLPESIDEGMYIGI